MSPAEKASQIALEKLYSALDRNKCFRFEAGAGAGKTYSLIKALKYLIKNKGLELTKNNQRIACITYTNIAVDEIKNRIDNNPVVFAGTIHEFSWSLIQSQQKEMGRIIPEISDKWKTRIDEVGGIYKQKIKYDLGYPKATDKEIYLHHDDVIKIITNLLDKEKFVSILRSKFPIIFIDEYQDTNKEFAEKIVSNIIEKEKDFLIGLFGDHWQKIYGTRACGLIESNKIEVINKEANFRSEKNIVNILNRIRPELQQHEYNPTSEGDIKVYLSENWVGERRSENHWQGDLPSTVAHQYLEKCKQYLETNNNWIFEAQKTKILMLTNNVLANEQGYSRIAALFSANSDEYLKKENPYIEFLIDTVEVMCTYFNEKKYGEMFKVMGKRTLKLNNHEDKKAWNRDFNELNKLRITSNIGEIIDYLKISKKPMLSIKIEEIEEFLSDYESLEDDKKTEMRERYDKYTRLRSIPYSEIVALEKYIDDKTPFSTKHGVKGAEFENVLIICGRGWNQYNWKEFLEWSRNGTPKGREDAYERNRNLFYVACSRPKKRLALLFTQKLSELSLETLNNWFGQNNINELVI